MDGIPSEPIGCNAKLPLIACDPKIADDAYAVWAALMRAAEDMPVLRDNPLWQFYTNQSRERFEIAYGVDK